MPPNHEKPQNKKVATVTTSFRERKNGTQNPRPPAWKASALSTELSLFSPEYQLITTAFIYPSLFWFNSGFKRLFNREKLIIFKNSIVALHPIYFLI